MTRFVAQPGSKVSIKGSNDIHDFDIQGKEIQGEAEFGTDFHTLNTKSVELGKIPARIEGFIPVRSLHYGVGTAMDKSLYHHLKAEAHPRILFHFSELSLKVAPNTNGAPFSFEAQGELVVAGVTNRVSMPLEVLPMGDDKLRLTVKLPVKMTDFGITPPQFAAKDYTIKYRDQIEVSVEWLVGRATAATEKDKP